MLSCRLISITTNFLQICTDCQSFPEESVEAISSTVSDIPFETVGSTLRLLCGYVKELPQSNSNIAFLVISYGSLFRLSLI